MYEHYVCMLYKITEDLDEAACDLSGQSCGGLKQHPSSHPPVSGAGCGEQVDCWSGVDAARCC